MSSYIFPADAPVEIAEQMGAKLERVLVDGQLCWLVEAEFVWCTLLSLGHEPRVVTQDPDEAWRFAVGLLGQRHRLKRDLALVLGRVCGGVTIVAAVTVPRKEGEQAQPYNGRPLDARGDLARIANVLGLGFLWEQAGETYPERDRALVAVLREHLQREAVRLSVSPSNICIPHLRAS